MLHADNALSSERKKHLLQAAGNDVYIAEMLSALDRSRLAFTAAFDLKALPPVPGKLRDNLHNLRRYVVTEAITPENWDRQS